MRDYNTGDGEQLAVLNPSSMVNFTADGLAERGPGQGSTVANRIGPTPEGTYPDGGLLALNDPGAGYQNPVRPAWLPDHWGEPGYASDGEGGLFERSPSFADQPRFEQDHQGGGG